MSEALKPSRRATSRVARRSTCSPASVGGRTRCGSRAGRTTSRSGLAAHPVSRFRALAADRARTTRAICGRTSTGSSRSVDLQSCLASKLRALLDDSGSPLYELTWRTQAMPWGAPILQRRALVRRTSGSVCSGWPTPTAISPGAGDSCNLRLIRLAVSGWPTPKAMEGWHHPGGHWNGGLSIADLMAGWPTPNLPNGGRSIATAERRGGTYYLRGRKVQFGLEAAARLARQGTGTPPTSSGAATEKPGSLNPEHSRWLMGYPTGWGVCAGSATRSSRSLRRRS